MGGKTWSFEEERFFWLEIIPRSPKAVDPIGQIMNWEMCAKLMQDSMGSQARRKYTKLMMFEHFFQNACTGHMSPHALAFVTDYQSQKAAAESAIQTAWISGQATSEVMGKAGDDGVMKAQNPVRNVAVGGILPRRGRPPAKYKHLPRLEIPTPQVRQAFTPQSDSSPTPGSYNSSPAVELPVNMQWPYRQALASSHSYAGYGPMINYPMYNFGSTSLGAIVSTEASASLSHHASTSVPVSSLVNLNSLPSGPGKKRKFDTAWEKNVDFVAPKRMMLPSPTYPLDTLAIAASRDYGTEEGSSLTAQNSEGSSCAPPTTTGCYRAATDADKAPQTGEVDPANNDQDPTFYVHTAPTFGGWNV